MTGTRIYLSRCINRRRPARGQADHAGAILAKLKERVCSRFVSRQRPRSADRKASRDRRRMFGGSSALPPNLRAFYTEGQRAVLCIAAQEVKEAQPIFQLRPPAALAGVCRTTVQNALHEARRLGHVAITERPQRGRKNLTNIADGHVARMADLAQAQSRNFRPHRVQSVETCEPDQERKFLKGQHRARGEAARGLGRKLAEKAKPERRPGSEQYRSEIFRAHQ